MRLSKRRIARLEQHQQKIADQGSFLEAALAAQDAGPEAVRRFIAERPPIAQALGAAYALRANPRAPLSPQGVQKAVEATNAKWAALGEAMGRRALEAQRDQSAIQGERLVLKAP